MSLINTFTFNETKIIANKLKLSTGKLVNIYTDIFVDVKAFNVANGGSIGGGLLPAHQNLPPFSPMAGMPFVSPYQINLMHQAAVRMTLANQLQGNMSRIKDGFLHAPMTHIQSKQVSGVTPATHGERAPVAEHQTTNSISPLSRLPADSSIDIR